METSTGIDFEEAARNRSQLTDRQDEVLGLIAEGLTNGEIAEALEITLDGAKWNVSEVLTKLGLPKREDAAAYYRWRRSPMQRVRQQARALVVGAVGLGAAAAVVGAIAFFPSSTPEDPAVSEGYYYIEYAVAYDNSAIGAVIPHPLPPISEAQSDLEGRQVMMRDWFSPPNLWRIEFDAESSSSNPWSSTTTFDGAVLVVRALLTNEFIRQSGIPQGRTDWDGQGLIPTTRFWGRVPGADADGYAALLENSMPPSPDKLNDMKVTRREGELNGLAVVIIEQSPVSCLYGPAPDDSHFADDGTHLPPSEHTVETADEDESSVGDPGPVCTGKRIMWLDEARMLILRTEVWTDDESLVAVVEVTAYEADVTHEAALFEFAPPPGAVDVTGSYSSNAAVASP